MAESGSPVRGIARRLGQHRLRDLVRETVAGVARNDLLTFGSAVAFQVAKSIPPLVMFSLALASLLGFEQVWTSDVAPQLAKHTSREFFALADHAAKAAFSNKEAWWLTAGLALTLWEVSGGVRTLMTATSRVYGAHDPRPRLRRYLLSFALALAVTLLPLAAIAVATAGGRVAGTVGDVLRWPCATGLLLTLVWLLLRFAPAEPRAERWVSFGSAVCVIAWLVTSIVFGLYVRDVASYGSIFASLAVVFVSLIYLYVSACAFLIGTQVDAVLSRAAEGTAAPS